MKVIKKITFEAKCDHCDALLEIEILDIHYSKDQKQYYCRCAVCDQTFYLVFANIPQSIKKSLEWRFGKRDNSQTISRSTNSFIDF